MEVNIEDDDSSDVEILDHNWSEVLPSRTKCSREAIIGKEKEVYSSPAHLKSHFVEMGFSPSRVDKVIWENGEGDVDAMLETLFTYKELRSETSGMMQKKRRLKDMGFTEDEISHAIDNFGPEVPISELADAIFANQIASAVATEEQKENTNAAASRHNSEEQDRGLNAVTYDGYPKGSVSGSETYGSKYIRKKRPKHLEVNNRTTSNINRIHGDNTPRHLPEGNLIRVEMCDLGISKFGKNVPILSQPLYLFYGNSLNIAEETWKRLSQSLYGIKPEFVETKFFSAIIKNEGYICELPIGRRVHVHPKPPMTLGEALPHTKKWWPAWDIRTKLSCIHSQFTEASLQCQRLGKMMASSQGMLAKEDKLEILQRCRTMNLIWTGRHKLSPITPEEMEYILGYPMKHTEVWGLSLDDRLGLLSNCLQVDTLAYHLSVLKDLYPEGIKVLSVFTGIGGAEVALHKLGIQFKYLISVEPVDSNREILLSWWKNSRQVGKLIEIKTIEEMSIKKLERIIEEIGGFDIVIGSNPIPNVSKNANRDASPGGTEP
ncbi:uncharacterized protein A4U43_C02F22320 [Asparagus officinalis]|uniref:SAM-dependent MTase DRM-type domain-containing protein n=1 Tax=Asparagus officinalis TaxID=4686 RepID=A0A5P1FP84_ASPOF|nr:uncharacterized protein A4U43_C02F22320 [Asparagus officinalis]